MGLSIDNQAGGTAAATISGSGDTYDIAIDGLIGEGDISVSILAGAANSVFGVGNVASTSTDNSVHFDSTLPTVQINQAAAQKDATNDTTINFTAVFSESVKAFIPANV